MRHPPTNPRAKPGYGRCESRRADLRRVEGSPPSPPLCCLCTCSSWCDQPDRPRQWACRIANARRWLLMWDDRVFAATLPSSRTDFLAVVLGFHRPAASQRFLHVWKASALSGRRESHVDVLDRAGLQCGGQATMAFRKQSTSDRSVPPAGHLTRTEPWPRAASLPPSGASPNHSRS